MRVAMSKTVFAPDLPSWDMRYAARANATSTEPVNSGLESSWRRYSIRCLLPPLVSPVRMTKPPCGQACMLTRQRFRVHKSHRGVVIRKVVGHLLDFALDARKVCALLRDYEYLTGMLLTGGQFRIFARADRFECFRYGYGVLTRVLDALDAAHSVRMSLADAAPPEGIVLALGQDAEAYRRFSENMPGSQPRR